MKKVFASNYPSPKGAKNKEISSFPGPKAFIPLPQISEDFGLLMETNMKRKIQCYKLNIEKSKDNSFIETYSWRLTTSLPIVRTFYLNLVSQQESNTLIEVFNQHCPHRLSYFSDLSVSIAFYLLKQSLIGLQRLWEKFGPFVPTEKMIAINQNGKCKVWMNENFALNNVKMAYLSQQQFLNKIFTIFQQKSIKNQTFKNFFRQAFLCTKFLKVFKLIDAFVQVQKIKIPMKFDVAVYENKKKLNSVRDTDLMKSSFTSKFFKSANYSKQMLKKSTSPRKQFALGSKSAYHPITKKAISSKCLQKSGTTLSQTYVRKRQQSSNHNPAAFVANCQSQIQDDTVNSPKTPNRKPNSKRVKGQLFMSGSIDADFLPEDRVKKPSFIPSSVKKFPNLAIGPLAESTMISSQQFKRFQNKINSSNQTTQIKIHAPNNIIKESNIKDCKKLPMYKRSTMQEDQQYDTVMDVQPILLKNGWQRKLGNLLGLENSKQIIQSRCQGKQIRADTAYIKLLKLDALGAGVTSSILPDEIDL